MKIYSEIRSMLSNKNKGRLSKFLFYSGMKPRVNRKSISRLNCGIVVFSADFEMAWAFRYSKTKEKSPVEIGLHERKNVPIILEMFNQHKIPITWAITGHLFLYECYRNEQGKAHAKMPRPSYFENRNWQFNFGDWYDHDPCSSYKKDPAWYAPDLIDKILQSKINHEVGCHTFSHIDMTYQNCTQELSIAELDACIKLAGEKGIKLRSMVFPGGMSGNFDILKQKGFTCYRKPMKNHLDLPYIDKYGLVAIPSSMGLDKDIFGWSRDFHLKMISKYLEKTVKYRQVCHFWFHPSMDSWYLRKILPEVVKMIGQLRDAGKLRVLPMKDLAEEIIRGD